jgi:DNA-binding transcriptional LysR family regulator
MQDLNNVRFFAKIVEHGSLTAASDALGVAKSMLSQHLSKLEAELGVQLMRRTSRRLQLTTIGARYYEQCRVILDEVAQASGIIDDVRSAPRGKLRIACPLNFSQGVLAPVLTSFMRKYPDVELVVDIGNRDAALVEEGYDFALYIGPAVKSSTVVTSAFRLGHELLIASPALLARYGIPRLPLDLKSIPSAAGHLPPERAGHYEWHLSGPGALRERVRHVPRLLSEDLWMILQSAVAGCSLAAMPLVLCRDELAAGRLVHVLPEWSLPETKLRVMYSSKRSLSVAARKLIDFLASQMRLELQSLLTGTWEFRIRSGGSAVDDHN